MLSIRIKRIRESLTHNEVVVLNLLAALIGVISGYIAIGFRGLIHILQNLAFFQSFSTESNSPVMHQLGWLVVPICIAGIWISWLLVRLFAKEAKGHGVPEVMEAVLIRKGRIRPRVVAVKSLASSICIGLGGSVGREGPIVQIGSAVGSTIGQILNFRPRLTKTLLGCGAVGGLAATFNTPVAAVIFAIEVILLEFKTRSFIPLVISGVMATMVSRMHLGIMPAFEVFPYTLAHPIELGFYLGLGILCALGGVLFIHILYGTEDVFEKLPISEWQKPIIGGLIIGLIGMAYPHIFGVGYHTMTQALASQAPLSLLVVLIFLKIIATSVTIGAGGSGGVFAPSLFIGAMLGGAYGSCVHALFPTITSGYGAYALVGMAAFFTATSRASFTAIVILFEMTLDYHIILPLMFAVVISDQISLWFSKHTIYTKKLANRGLELSQDMGINTLDIKHVGSVMTTDIMTVDPETSLTELQTTLLPSGHHTFPVVDKDQKVLGLVLADDIRSHLKKENLHITASEVMTQPKVISNRKDTLMFALRKIEKTGQSRLLVVDRVNRTLEGMITGRDILKALYTEE